jgi:hypothetical protein
MTRSTKSVISILASVASIAAIAPAAVADTGTALDGNGAFSSAATLARDDNGPVTDTGTALDGNGAFTSTPSLVGGQPSDVPESVSRSSDAFDWRDALIGAGVGLVLAVAMGAAFVAVRRRGRPRIQPSV